MPQTSKNFIVFEVTTSTDLDVYGYLLIAKDGEAWQIIKHKKIQPKPWYEGQVITIMFDEKNCPDWGEIEDFSRLPYPPAEIIKQAWGAIKS